MVNIWPDLTGDALDSYRRVVAEMKKRLKQETGLSDDQVIVRQARPEDFGLSDPEGYIVSAVTSTTAFNQLFSNTIADNRYIAIYGVYNNEDSSDISAIRVTSGGETARYWTIQPLEFFQDNSGYFPDPVIADQNTVLLVEFWARNNSTINDWGVIGVVVEKRGLLVNP